MQYLLVALLIALGIYFVARWFVNQPTARLVGAVRNASKWALIALGGLLLARGQVYIGMAMIAVGVAGLMGTRAGSGWLGTGRSARSGGKASQVRSRMLEMQLDHDTGAIDGTVLKGDFEGYRLSDMSLEDLLALHAQCVAENDQSPALLEAFLDRAHPDWHEGLDGAGEAGRSSNGSAHMAGGVLSREQAFEVLGLPTDASDAAIRRAHKTLMKQFHPDKGGSDYLAAMINQAKDLLLR